MRHPNIILSISLATAMGIALASCSSINLPFLNNSKKETEKQDAVLPTDREHIHSGRHQQTYSVKDLEEGVVTGDWTIDSVNGAPLPPDVSAYLKFVPKEKRVYGNNGCNTINATYAYDPAEHKLSFTDALSTMRLCNIPSAADEQISLAIENTRSYSWNHENDRYFLHFFDETGRRVLTLMHQNFDFLNGTWGVTEIDGEPIDNKDIQLVIDIDESKIHGNTGCNILNGAIDIDMESANTIAFHDIITTRMACPNPGQQTRLIVALEDAAHAKPVDANTVVLLNLLHKPVLTLKRMQ